MDGPFFFYVTRGTLSGSAGRGILAEHVNHHYPYMLWHFAGLTVYLLAFQIITTSFGTSYGNNLINWQVYLITQFLDKWMNGLLDSIGVSNQNPTLRMQRWNRKSIAENAVFLKSIIDGMNNWFRSSGKFNLFRDFEFFGHFHE